MMKRNRITELRATNSQLRSEIDDLESSLSRLRESYDDLLVSSTSDYCDLIHEISSLKDLLEDNGIDPFSVPIEDLPF